RGINFQSAKGISLYSATTLDMRYPGEVYIPSNKEYKGLPEVDYPFHDKMITVTHCGRLCLKGKKINLTSVLAGQNVGIKGRRQHLVSKFYGI
ncbi:hypothetical protein, partial [Legionella pneumophila]